MNEPDITTVREYIEKSGYILEFKVAKELSDLGYRIKTGSTFFDLEERKEREVDVIASKVLDNGIELNLIIECKQSQENYWLFICNDKKFIRGDNVKHLPTIDISLRNRGRSAYIFKSLHYFNKDLLCAYNYEVVNKNSKSKKGNNGQIHEVIKKMPKALISRSTLNTGGKKLFFPVVIFEGQMFSATYDNNLSLEKTDHVKFLTELSSQIYSLNPRGYLDETIFGGVETETRKILEARKNLGESFTIDFITKNYLPTYMANLERDVGTIQVDQWV